MENNKQRKTELTNKARWPKKFMIKNQIANRNTDREQKLPVRKHKTEIKKSAILWRSFKTPAKGKVMIKYILPFCSYDMFLESLIEVWKIGDALHLLVISFKFSHYSLSSFQFTFPVQEAPSSAVETAGCCIPDLLSKINHIVHDQLV